MELEAIAMAGAALAAQGFFGEAGRVSWAGVGRLVTTIRSRLNGSYAASSALTAVEEEPEDSVAQQELGNQLLSLMLQDMRFRAQMEQFVRAAQQSGAIPATKNDYRGATIEKVVNVETVNGDLNF
ncbi:hypothetical protein ACFC5X_06800 [Streptomyces sp. NPDC055952]|uniref:hypothetical protein n=1 Tax=Streptomyces sp. NPDC055952 TaxID=3345663 RepID=UPI0035E220EA